MSIENLSEAVGAGGDEQVASTLSENKDGGLDNSDSEMQASTTTQSPASSWLSDIDEDLRGNKSLGKFSDVKSLAKSYIELEKNFDKRVPLPSSDADDEAWNKFYKIAGLPEDGKYLADDVRAELLKDGADTEALSAYEQLFHKSGLTARQGRNLLDNLRVAGAESETAHQENILKTKEQNFRVLSNKYGDSIDEKIKIVQASMQKYGSKELAELGEQSHFAPSLVDLLIKIGEPLQSDSLVSAKSKSSASIKDSAVSEIKKLESDDKFMLIYNDKGHAGNSKAVDRMQDLYNLAYN
jgi:hypothetical protein